MFKRIVGLIVVALLCLSVVSCGKKDEENKVELGDASKSEIASESEDVQDISNSTQQQEGKSNETTQEEKTDGQVGEETSKEDNQKEKADEEPKEINPELTETKTGKVETETFLGNYYMELELIFDENTDDEAVMKCCYAVEDLNSYFRIKNDIMDFSMIIKPEVRYTVDNNSKQYLEGLHDFLLSFSEVIKRLRIGELYSETSSDSFEVGTVEIDGKNYSYEMFKEDENSTSQYAFDENDELKYVIVSDNGEKTIMKIVKLEKEMPDGIFEIPVGYTEYVSKTQE